MSADAQTLDRLLVALEDLVAGERSALQAGDHPMVVALQERADPVVARVVELAPVASPQARERVRALLERREEHGRWLQESMANARSELARMSEGQRVVARIAPVYGRSPSMGASQFSSQA
jgi:hypothetical protein